MSWFIGGRAGLGDDRLGLRSSTKWLTSMICRGVIGGSAPEPSAR